MSWRLPIDVMLERSLLPTTHLGITGEYPHLHGVDEVRQRAGAGRGRVSCQAEHVSSEGEGDLRHRDELIGA